MNAHIPRKPIFSISAVHLLENILEFETIPSTLSSHISKKKNLNHNQVRIVNQSDAVWEHAD